MLSYDSEARRQLARERAQELAREARLARGPAEYRAGRRRVVRPSSIVLAVLGVLRREAPQRAPAYRG